MEPNDVPEQVLDDQDDEVQPSNDEFELPGSRSPRSSSPGQDSIFSVSPPKELRLQTLAIANDVSLSLKKQPRRFRQGLCSKHRPFALVLLNGAVFQHLQEALLRSPHRDQAIRRSRRQTSCLPVSGGISSENGVYRPSFKSKSPWRPLPVSRSIGAG